MNLNTFDKKIYLGRDGDGVSSVCVHPSKKYFAVAENGNFPNIYIHEYPSIKLYRVLRKGAELAYSNVCFSSSGLKLASISSEPD